MSEPVTLGALLRANATACGSRSALVTHERSITHAELDEATRSTAGRLVADGIGKGSRLGLLAPNGIDWALVALAAMRVGAVLVPLSTLLRPPELAVQLRLAAVSHLVVVPTFRGRSYLEDLDDIAPGLRSHLAAGRRHPTLPDLQRTHVLDELPPESVDGLLVDALEARVRPADDLVVLFTSGSRGTPKGTVHTHDGALAAVAASLGPRCLTAQDRLYIPMPFFWTGGLSMGLLSVVVAGATLLTEAVPEPDRTLELLQRERVTLFRGWPDQAAALAAHPGFATADLSGLTAGSLPAVLPPETRPAPGARPNLFGMTETFGTYLGGRLDLDLPPDKRGSCGRPFDGVEVGIADPETGGPVDPVGRGELCVRGRNVMRGIVGRTRDQVFDRDGWYHTGDLGRIDDDGYVWFEGRADDMFKVRGATVYPAEVEVALRGVDGVAQAHVTDLHDPGGARVVAALVVADRPAAELRAAAAERLSAFKVPSVWMVTSSADDVPLTATSKVDKAALQHLLGRHGQRADGARANTEGEQRA